jgi:predicted MFS family arabinose efflux permease
MSDIGRLSGAGFAATAIAFGPGRTGFGLFLPEFREAFDISSGTAGLISGAGFTCFLLALVAAQALDTRRGPRAPVALGLMAAALGAGIVAAATNVALLALGTVLVMSSAGFAWTPFNDAVHRALPEAERPRSLSVVSTGTSIGVTAAAICAAAVALSGMSWRVAWAIFATAAGAAAIGNLAALRSVRGASGPMPEAAVRRLLARRAWPLHAAGLSFGITTAIYISFAADRIVAAGGLPGTQAALAAPIVFVAYGVFGLAGLGTGCVRARIGLPTLLRALLLASTASHVLVALAPTGWAAVILSAGLQGLYVMMASAVLSFWSERLFPALPSTGFTAALLAVAAGSIAGPVVAGLLRDAAPDAAIFLGAAAVSGLSAFLLPRAVSRRSGSG